MMTVCYLGNPSFLQVTIQDNDDGMLPRQPFISASKHTGQ